MRPYASRLQATVHSDEGQKDYCITEPRAQNYDGEHYWYLLYNSTTPPFATPAPPEWQYEKTRFNLEIL